MDINGKSDIDAWQRHLEGVLRREREETRARLQLANGELFKAVEQNDLNGVSTWLTRGANPNANRGWQVERPLFLAVGYERMDRRIAELLVDRGANVHARDAGGRTALHVAASGRDKAHVALLLDRGAEVNTRDDVGRTPLHEAADCLQIGQMKFLLSRGADANARDNRGETPLHVALRRGEESHVGVLLDHGAEVNTCDDMGRTPLHEATDCLRIGQMEFLLSRGADANARDNRGETPLHIALRRGEESHISVLLDHGADIDARDVTGETPLHKAAAPPRIEHLMFLVSRGADVSVADNRGRTPLDVLRLLRDDHEWCKKHTDLATTNLDGRRWEMLRGLLGGFTTVKVTEALQDRSLIVRIEGHHGRFPDALQEARERGGLAVPSDLVFGRDAPEAGRLVRCRKGLSPVLDHEWAQRCDRELRCDRGIELGR